MWPIDKAMQYCERRHEHWYMVLAAFCDTHVGKRPVIPQIEFALRTFKWAGMYRGVGKCIYPLPYVMLNEHDYDETIAHEMCHAFQKKIDPRSKWHGEIFKFLIRHVCGFREHTCKHHYSVAQAKQLGDLLCLRSKLENGRVKAPLGGMPSSTDTTPVS